jgi:hypothetical protein
MVTIITSPVVTPLGFATVIDVLVVDAVVELPRCTICAETSPILIQHATRMKKLVIFKRKVEYIFI